MAKETTMQSPRLPTHRLRFSPLQLTVPRRPATDHQNTVHELLLYISVLPEQFYDPSTSLASRRPEAELMRAVLEDALLCFQRGLIRQGRRVQRLAREAKEWLFSDDTNWPFSFVSICAVLGLEPDYIRRGLAIQEMMFWYDLQRLGRRRILCGVRQIQRALLALHSLWRMGTNLYPRWADEQRLGHPA
jgi:hypothetical protein